MMKLYVWDNVLTDYTSGIMVAAANNVAEARKILRAQYPSSGLVAQDLMLKPCVYSLKTPVCRAVWGGR